MEPDVLPRINRVILTGFLQQDPELRSTPSGVAVSSFRVRSSTLVRDRRGAPRETISYVTVVVWAELAQRICREVKNGQGIYVEGSLHSRSFQTSGGERKTVVEVYADSIETVPIFLTSAEGRDVVTKTERGPEHRGPSESGYETMEHPHHEEAPHPHSESESGDFPHRE